MKKLLYFSISLVVVLTLSLILYINVSDSDQKIKHTLIQEINSLSRQYQMTFQWDSLSVQKTSLKVQLRNLKIHHPQYKDIFFSDISFQINLLRSLIHGKLVFNIIIKEWNPNINLASLKHTRQSSLTPNLANIPIYKIFIKDSNMELKTPHKTLNLKNLNLYIKNQNDFLSAEWDTHVSIDNLKFQMESHIEWSPEQITTHYLNLEELEVDKNPSSLFLLGHIQPFVTDIQSASLDIKTNFSIKILNTWLQVWDPERSISDLSGLLTLSSKLSYSKNQGFSGPFQIEAQNVQWKHIFVSKIKSEAQLDQHHIHFKMAHLEKDDEWRVFLDKTSVQLNKNLSFSSQSHAYIKNFETVESILKTNIGLKFNGPVTSACNGKLRLLDFKCKMQATLHNVDIAVTTDPSIAFLPKLQLSGDLDWKKKNFKGSLHSNSHTSIRFQTSLKSHSKTRFSGNLDFSDTQHIYGLNLKGKVKISRGQMDITPKNNFFLKAQLNFKDFVLNDFKMGHVTSSFAITDNDLVFNRVKGFVNKSQYKGRIKILFSKPRIQITSQFQPLSLTDFGQSVNLPFPMSGEGSAQFSMNSPLDWSLLQYDLQSQFKNVRISDEFFPSAEFHLNSKKGLSTLTKVLLKKIQGQIEAKGHFKFFDKLNLAIQGKDLILEGLSFLTEFLNPHLSGMFDFQLKVKGISSKPIYTFKGISKNLLYHSKPQGSASLNLNLSNHIVTGQASLFNKKLKMRNFKWNQKTRIISAHLNAKKANIIPLIPLNFPSQFSSEITANTSLSFLHKQWDRLTGHLTVKELLLTDQSHQMKLSQPTDIQLNDGLFSFKKSNLEFVNNTKTPLFLKKINSTRSILSGPIRLEFLTPFFPVIEQAQGLLDMHFSIQNNLNQFSPTGSFQIKNAALKTKMFLNTFQSVNIESTFTPEKLTFQKITAQTLHGNLKGNGFINYSHPDTLPINISSQFDRMVLTLSETTKLQGSGSIRLHGNRKPYLIDGNFFLDNGYSKGEFSAENNLNLPSIEEDLPLFHLKLLAHLKNPFIIQNELIDASVTGLLHFSGSYKQPFVSGSLDFIPNGVFRLRDYDFRIDSGQVHYERNYLFDPKINIVGQTIFEKPQFLENQEVTDSYTITANIQGPIKSLDLKLSSEPALSENNILSMMALGARSIVSPQVEIFSNVAQYSYSKIASALFQNTMGRRLENLFGVRLSIIPYINEQKTTNQVRALKRWSDKLQTSATTVINEMDQSLQVEYNLSPNLSLLGTWGTWRENKENTIQEEYNLEIEYKINF